MSNLQSIVQIVKYLVIIRFVVIFCHIVLIFVLIGKYYECSLLVIKLSIYNITININFCKCTNKLNQLNTTNMVALYDF